LCVGFPPVNDRPQTVRGITNRFFVSEARSKKLAKGRPINFKFFDIGSDHRLKTAAGLTRTSSDAWSAIAIRSANRRAFPSQIEFSGASR